MPGGSPRQTGLNPALRFLNSSSRRGPFLFLCSRKSQPAFDLEVQITTATGVPFFSTGGKKNPQDCSRRRSLALGARNFACSLMKLSQGGGEGGNGRSVTACYFLARGNLAARPSETEHPARSNLSRFLCVSERPAFRQRPRFFQVWGSSRSHRTSVLSFFSGDAVFLAVGFASRRLSA